MEFYVLASANPAGRLRAACQLAAKGWRHGLPVLLRCANETQRDELDQLLWRFRAESFIPHGSPDDDTPVVLALDEAPTVRQGLLINLAPRISPHVEHFSRVIEIVNQEPELLAACRENFLAYRQRGYDPKRIEL